MITDATIKLINTIDVRKYMVTIFYLPKQLKSPVNDFCLLLAVSFLLNGCSTTQPPVPVVDRAKADAVQPKPVESSATDSQVYVVQKGDTLFGIALAHGIDFKKLMEWNDISDPKSLKPGQKINVSMPVKSAQPTLFALPKQPETIALEPGQSPAEAVVPPPPQESNYPVAQSGKVKTSPKALKLPFSEQNVARLQYPENKSTPAIPPAAVVAEKNNKVETAPQPVPSESDKPGSHSVADWIWPTTGKLLSSFSKNSKGVKISGQAGQPILASAAGEVVYSGHGLRGYGNLIIIKHDNTFLSAYAHNSKLLVKEGEAVVKGQKIAEMGNTDTDTIQLHFEIRKYGKPVDPLQYLPSQS
ncbi:MAG: peptidoglycan DD-metalloendopeptidase family protein [Proteobacteria bacterium]|nr:peptidoglycan DD-metalloendopeptidase family protein [Pseudomonadota bacterium]